ncbi:hypothetical protein FA09DRAFT_361275 [Tilletiopsis washingtonensis]|jgi:hypothetical protein|uniref:Uncharacterized protein n=1 Tax=Tilletiopsis washingtonensis TaxID=58919 RepID=A0A316Z6S3_9BASI|nr:hypothetical protein FA09DRAFT_361275 [Tilletiopsis washingtonensis]PWN97470.1 hypothetical protein FA09DRAFT_361275 [Tilletiopsis washingtonensis]
MMTLHAPAPRRPIPLLRRRGHAHSSSLSSSSGSGSHAALLGVTSASTFASAPVSRAPSSRSAAPAAAQPPCTPPRDARRSIAAQLEDAAADQDATPTRARTVDASGSLCADHGERIARAASPGLLPPLSPSTLHLEALRRSASPAGRTGGASDASSSRCTSAAPTTAPSSPAPSSGLAAMHPHTPRAAFGLATVHSPIPRDWTLNPLARRRLDAVFLEAETRAVDAAKHSS